MRNEDDGSCDDALDAAPGHFGLRKRSDQGQAKGGDPERDFGARTGNGRLPRHRWRTLALDPSSSKVDWVASKVTKSHNGKFKQFTGKIDLVGGKPEASKVTVDIDLGSVEADAPKLTEHLKSADFFDVAKHPKATFTSTEIKPGVPGGATHTVTGLLDLHGVKKTITFPANVEVSDNEVGVKAEFSINRKDFNINYTGAADDLIRDNVLLKLDVKAPRKK